MTRQLVAEVFVELTNQKVNKPFHYEIPDELKEKIKVGSRVLIPFGPRRIEGYVTFLPEETDYPKLKSILKVLEDDPVLSPVMIELAFWMSQYYLTSMSKVLQTMLPVALRPAKGDHKRVKIKKQKVIEFAVPLEKVPIEIAQLAVKAPKQALILQRLLAQHPLSESQLLEETKASPASLKSLLEKGLIEITEVPIFRTPTHGQGFQYVQPKVLTKDQHRVLLRIQEGKAGQVFLLHGVTGSGKTEVYIQALQKVIQEGKTGIVLVPEISLTPQTVQRFKGRFGEAVAILHSRLSQGERYDEWRRIHQGEAQVVVGARSAVFAPLTNLGLIIIDEEHEHTYKQEESPRYHTRDVAIKRAEITGAKVILGSATPALETYYRALQGDFTLLTMDKRVENQSLPEVTILDMRQELKEGNKTILGRSLRDAITKALNNKEQVILLLNRRGFSTFVSCRECGISMRCPSCEVALTYHANIDKLTCHYCQYTVNNPKICPQCASKYIRYFGAGTQRIEEEVNLMFPEARVVRMDVDTTGKKGAHEAILESFGRGEYDILVGTQMIAKGLDFPNVTVVGVISADTALNLPDFRSAEKTFQLLTQVAGRAGRGSKEGKVFIQTYNPEHYAVVTSKDHDYLAFYQNELALRKVLNNPPFSSLVRLLIWGPEESSVIKVAQDLRDVFGEQIELLGPAPAPVPKLRNNYRWHLLIKGDSPEDLLQLLKLNQQQMETLFNTNKNIKVSIDMEPQYMM